MRLSASCQASLVSTCQWRRPPPSELPTSHLLFPNFGKSPTATPVSSSQSRPFVADQNLLLPQQLVEGKKDQRGLLAIRFLVCYFFPLVISLY